jgi:hypothetical protein
MPRVKLSTLGGTKELNPLGVNAFYGPLSNGNVGAMLAGFLMSFSSLATY